MSSGVDLNSGNNLLSTNLRESVENMPATSWESFLTRGSGLLFFLIGAGAVIVIIYAGLKMILGSGDPGEVKKAKNMVVYASIGLAVAILSYAIVEFALSIIP